MSESNLGVHARLADSPRLVLHDSALSHNIRTMSRYARQRGVLLAPHAKTSLSPTIVAKQLAAGAWGATAANVAQVRGLLAVGCENIILANEVVDRVALDWIARTYLMTDVRGSLWCYVDSVAGIERAEAALEQHAIARPMTVLVDVGYAGGRTGVRTLDQAIALAQRLAESPLLELGGVAGYEGQMPAREGEVPVDLYGYMDRIRDVVENLTTAGLLPDEPIVTAGGSSYFDAVVDCLDPKRFDRPIRFVLRSGCYVTHDHGLYERTSPWGRSPRLGANHPRLIPALTLKASVLSRPEPTLAIADFGRRHAPFDDALPIVVKLPAGRDSSRARDVTVEGLNDQHAYLRLPEDLDVRVGDVIDFGVSHPCGAFDRWSRVGLVDDDGALIGDIATDLER